MSAGINGDLANQGSKYVRPLPNIKPHPYRESVCFIYHLFALNIKIRWFGGLSDHDIVTAEVNANPTVMKPVPSNILLYKKADWDQLKESMSEFHKIIQSDLATADIQVLWDEFVTKLQQSIDTCIPVRKAGSRNGLLWVNQEIRRLMRRRDKCYKRWTRSGRPTDQKKFLDYKHLVHHMSERAY